MLMPEGPDGYGQFDYNHIRQFWMLTKKNQENENMAIIEAMQDQKKILAQKIQEYESSKNEDNQNQSEI